jgi:hypothetical protein
MENDDDELLQSHKKKKKEKRKVAKGGNEGLIALGYLAEFGPNKTCKKSKSINAQTLKAQTLMAFMWEHHLFIHPSIHTSIHSFIHPSMHSFIHSSIHSFIHSFFCSFIHLPCFHS